MHLAARHGQLQVVEALLAHGASACGLNDQLQTPLRVAMESGHVDVAMLLASASGMPALQTG